MYHTIMTTDRYSHVSKTLILSHFIAFFLPEILQPVIHMNVSLKHSTNLNSHAEQSHSLHSDCTPP